MPHAVFVERELTARKGKKRTKLHLRVFAPVPDGNAFACSYELTVAGKPSWAPARLYGGDGLQAFALTMRFVGARLLQLELEHGFRIDAWHWADIVELLGDVPLSTYERDRIDEIKAELRDQVRALGEADEARRTPRAAAARRKPRTATKRRGSSRSRSSRP